MWVFVLIGLSLFCLEMILGSMKHMKTKENLECHIAGRGFELWTLKLPLIFEIMLCSYFVWVFDLRPIDLKEHTHTHKKRGGMIWVCSLLCPIHFYLIRDSLKWLKKIKNLFKREQIELIFTQHNTVHERVFREKIRLALF